MSTMTAVVLVTAATALAYALVVVAVCLLRPDRSSAGAPAMPGNAEHRRDRHASMSVTAGDETPSAPSRSNRRAKYLEIGAWSGRTYPPRAVVVGYDGKAHSRAAVAWAANEAARRDLPLVVLHAANYPGMTGEPGPGLCHRDPGALDAAEEVTASGVAEAVDVVPWLDVVGATEVTSAARALLEASRDASLVVVGSRGAHRLFGVKWRSVGLAVASRGHAPVVVVGGGSQRKLPPASSSGEDHLALLTASSGLRR
jgi:nucleotide-binding universal stress UspA family protein